MYNADGSGERLASLWIGMKKDTGKLQSNWNSLCILPERWHFDQHNPPDTTLRGLLCWAGGNGRGKDTIKWFINPICSDIQVALGHRRSKYSHNKVQVNFWEQAGISYKVRCLQATSTFFFLSIPSLTDNQPRQLHFTKSLVWLTAANMWGIQSKRLQTNKPTQQWHSVSWHWPKIHPTLKSRQLYHVFSVFSLVLLGWLFCSTSHHQVRAYICSKPKPYLGQFTDKETEAK